MPEAARPYTERTPERRMFLLVFCVIQYAFSFLICVSAYTPAVVVAGQSFQIDAEMLYVLLSGLMTCL